MHRSFFLLLIAWLTQAQPSLGQTLPQLTLPQIVAASVRSTPNLAVIDRELAGRIADALAAEARLNPEIETFVRYGLERERVGFEVELGIPFRGSDFGARAVYGTALRAAGDMERRAALFAVAAEAATLYVSLWAAQERATLAQQAAAQAQSIEAALRRLERDPRRPVSTLRLFSGEAERQRLLFETLETERQTIAATLELTSAFPVESATIAIPFDQPLPPLPALLAQARETQWNRRVAEASLRLADRRLEVARRDAGPTFTPRLRYERTIDGEDEIGVGIALPFPLFDRNQAEIARALADQGAAAMQLRFIDERGLNATIGAAHRRAARYEASAQAYEQTVMPAFESNLALVREQFERGQASLLEVWQLQQSLLAVRREALEAKIAGFAARVELQRAVGTFFEEETP